MSWRGKIAFNRYKALNIAYISLILEVDELENDEGLKSRKNRIKDAIY